MPGHRQANGLSREMNVAKQKHEFFAVLSDISNTLSNDNFYDEIIPTPRISLKYIQIQRTMIMESKLLSKVFLKSAKELSQKWYTGIDTDKATVRVMMQKGIQPLIYPFQCIYHMKQ